MSFERRAVIGLALAAVFSGCSGSLQDDPEYRSMMVVDPTPEPDMVVFGYDGAREEGDYSKRGADSRKVELRPVRPTKTLAPILSVPTPQDDERTP